MHRTRESDPQTTYCYSVRAEADPSVLPRLLALFAKRGLMPAALHARRYDHGASALQVDIEATGLDQHLAEYLQRCMRQIVAVDLVLLSTKHVLKRNDVRSVARAS